MGSKTERTGTISFFVCTQKTRKYHINDLFLSSSLTKGILLKIVQVIMRTMKQKTFMITLALNDTVTHFTIVCGDFNAKKTDVKKKKKKMVWEAETNAVELCLVS